MAGLFGKVPSQRDFVRVNIGGPVVRALDEWLRESVMTLPSLRAHVPVEPVPFVLRAANQSGFVVGVLQSSHDGVGREFPIAIFQPFDGHAHARSWSALPLAYAEFLRAATDLLGQADTLTLDRLADQLDELPQPTPAEVEAKLARELGRLAEISADELLDRLFSRPTGNPEGERWVDDHLYGLGMVLQACSRVAGPPMATASITLDCPIGGELELVFWLELVRRNLAWSSPPSFLWSQANARLLLALGSPKSTLLGVLGTPGTFDPEIWPLLTDDEHAAAAGGQWLTPEQRAAIARPGQSAAELLDAVTRAARGA